MALVGYLRHCATNGFYCAVPPKAGPEEIWKAVARALEFDGEIASNDELLKALAARAPIELALDCEQLPDDAGIDAQTV
jgi:hypothetical protein